jgi:hypothetical protein
MPASAVLVTPEDMASHLLGLVLTRVVREADVSPLRGQPSYDLRAYPAAAPRDQRHLASQPILDGHRNSLRLQQQVQPPAHPGRRTR